VVSIDILKALKALIITIRLPKAKQTYNKKRGKMILRLIDNYISIIIINNAWFFKIKYKIGDNSLYRATCKYLCTVL
jgi:hypothetical protein